jgi:hypothetical protein
MIPYPSSAPAASAPLAICVAAMRVRLAEQLEAETARSVSTVADRVQRSGT